MNLPVGGRPVRGRSTVSDKRRLLRHLEVLNNTFDGVEVEFNLSEYANKLA